MSELFTAADQQRRDLLGEAPAFMESAMMRSLLGERPMQQGLIPYEGIAKTHEHVNDLEIGKSLGHHVLADMVQSNVSISTLLPFQQVAASVSFFSWSIERFKPGIAPVVPEEAPFSEITFFTEPRRVKLQRRGAAVRMTANIMNTPEGAARLQSQLLKLGSTILLTIEHLMLQALVTVHDGPMFKRKMTLDKHDDAQILDQLSYDAARFASWNRIPDIEAAKDMSDTAAVLGEFTRGPYAVLYPTGKASMLGGTVLDTPQGLRIKTMNSRKEIIQMESPTSNMRMADGSLGFPVPDYSFSRGARRMQPLLRATMIAEHYHMNNIKADDVAYRTGHQLQGAGFSTDQRDIWVYDVDQQDDFVKVSFKDAFEHSGFVSSDRDGHRTEPLKESIVRTFSSYTNYTGTRSAPSRLTFNGGPQYVAYFGGFDENVVSKETHRRVGSTIAAAVYRLDDNVLTGLSEGFAFLRDLAQAPFDPDFNLALGTIFVALNGSARQFYQAGQPAGDLGAMFGGAAITNIWAFPQSSNGALVLGRQSDDFDDAVAATGTPPYMLSLGALETLAIFADNARNAHTAALGKRAKNLLDTARVIYGVLRDRFPGARAIQADRRPLNFLAQNGFATWFASVFLNSGNPVLIMTTAYDQPDAAAGASTGPDVDIITPFVVNTAAATALIANTVVRAAVVGGAANRLGVSAANHPLAAVTGGTDALVGSQMNTGPAHTRTPWFSQHKKMKVIGAQERLRASTRRASGRYGSEAAEEEEEDDMFGMRPNFHQSAPMLSGAPIDGLRERNLIRRAVLPADGNARGDDELAFNPNNIINWDAADAIDDPLIRVCTMTYVTAPCSQMEHYTRMMDSNILVPFDIFLVRPALETDMYSIIVMKPGLDTGLHAIADTVLDYGKDVDHQTRKLTFSIRHATIIKAPDNVAILPSRISRRYIGGGGVQLYDNADQLSNPTDSRPDLISFIVPMGTSFHRVEPIGGIDISGLYGGRGTSRYPDATFYEAIWGLSFQAIATIDNANRYYDASAVIPTYSWRGEYLTYDRKIRYPAAGHRCGGSHPGCRKIWDGNQDIFPPMPDF